MSFEGSLTQERGPSVFSLFEFEMAEGLYLRYTDADESVSFEGNWYTPEAVSYGDVVTDGSLTKATLTVSAPRNIKPAKMMRLSPPSFESVLRIWEGNFSDRDREFRPLWQGRILNCKIERAKAEFSCEPKSTSLSRPGLRRNYQRACPHAVYGDLCKASRAEQPVTWVAATGNVWTVTQPATGYISPETYSGGLLVWTNAEGIKEVQTILTTVAVGGNLELRTNRAAPEGTSVTGLKVVKGCDHSEDACTQWHNNIGNFGGQVFIPTDNPINKLSTYY